MFRPNKILRVIASIKCQSMDLKYHMLMNQIMRKIKVVKHIKKGDIFKNLFDSLFQYFSPSFIKYIYLIRSTFVNLCFNLKKNNFCTISCKFSSI